MIFHTRIITLPRSGHTWLAQLLQYAIGDEMVYSEYHSNGKTLENSPEINVQKTHDFELDVPTDDEFVKIIQYRNFNDATESWYQIAPNAPFLFTNNRSEFERKAREWRSKWEDKWLGGSTDRRIYISYYALRKYTQLELTKVIMEMTGLRYAAAYERAMKAIYTYPAK